ncbi:unnamed protein product [Ceutorhynchus assimilis]|uniref:Uncharacterized protein n=1 Tax=Ceutorhynchus assimilis TaxID=467358 RepID=A0A9N9MY94_9CUCU|nr:unnamed protein product [Ceutorhynchus assimilis]
MEKDNTIEDLQGKYEVLNEDHRILKSDIEDRDNFIARLKRGSRSFEDEACDREEQLKKNIESHVKLIEKLNQEIKQLKEEQNVKQTEISDTEVKYEIQRQNLEELKSKNHKMATSITNLQSEIAKLVSESRSGKMEIAELNEALQSYKNEHKAIKEENLLLLEKMKAQSTTYNLLEDMMDSADQTEKDRTINNKEEIIAKMKEEVKELKEINKSMTVSISVLEEENKRLEKELKELQMEFDQILAEHISSEKSLVVNDTESKTKKTTKVITKNTHNKLNVNSTKKQANITNIHDANIITNMNDAYPNDSIEVIGSTINYQYGKYLLPYLESHLSDKFDVQIVTKPNALFVDVIGGHEESISKMSSSDYVIVMAGLNNNNVKLSDITLIANTCFYTNLIFCTIPAKCTDGLPYCHVDYINDSGILQYILQQYWIDLDEMEII